MRSKHVLMAATVLLSTGCGHKKYTGDDKATVPPPGGNQEEQDQQLPTFTRHCLNPASVEIATTVEALKSLVGSTDCRAAQKLLSEKSVLSLQGTKLGSLAPLADLKGLKELSLSDTGLTKLDELKGLSNLTTLKVSGNSLKGGVPLTQFPALTNLEAMNSAIEGTAWLAGSCKLSRLELSGNELGDFSGIKSCPALVDLGLARTKMTDGDTKNLEGLAALSRLNVGKNELTSAAFAAKLTALTDINAEDNKITSLMGLAGLKQLKTLSFAGNPVMTWSKTYPSSCPVAGTASPALSTYCGTLLKKHQPFHWTCLNVVAETDPRRMTVDAVYDALEMKGKTCAEAQDILASQKKLDLNGKSVTELSPLAKLSSLESLNLAANGLEGKGSLEALVGLSSLKKLDVGGNKMANGINFAQFPALEHIRLASNGISDISWLPAECTLKGLLIGGNQIEDLSPIRRCQQLEKLNLAGSELTKDRVEQAGIASLKNLKDLHVGSNGLKSLAFVSSLTKLEYLQAGYNELTAIDPLAGLAELKYVALPNNEFNSLAPLKPHKNLKVLDVAGNKALFTWDETFATRCPSVDTGSKVLAFVCRDHIKKHNGFLWHCLTITDKNDSRYHVIERVLATIRESPADCTKGYAKLQREPAKIKRNLNLSASIGKPKLENLVPLHDSVFKFVKRLSLDNNEIKNLQPLTTWEGLRYLSVSNNPLRAMPPLRFFPLLKELRLANVHLRNPLFITDGHGLEKLFINGPKMETYNGIEKLTMLTSIQLAASPQIKELGVIETMSQLRALNIMANPQFTSFDFSKFPKLEYLGVVDQSSTAGYLADLGLPASLKHLDARFNSEDTASFNMLPAIVPNLRTLNMFGNDELKSLAKMKALGAGEWDELAAFCASSVKVKSKKECPTSKVPTGIADYCSGKGSGLPGCPLTADGTEVEPFELYLLNEL